MSGGVEDHWLTDEDREKARHNRTCYHCGRIFYVEDPNKKEPMSCEEHRSFDQRTKTKQ